MEERIRLLLVDDDEDYWVLTREILKDIEGSLYDLECAATFEEAIEVLKQFRHDAYLFDYNLGERDGIELIKESIAAGCKSPIIMLTGKGDYRVDRAAMEAGASDYLNKKKINPELFERVIRYSVERKRSEEELNKYRDHLEELVKERTAELTRSNELLKQINTQLRHTEKKLRESEERARALINAPTDNVFLIDKMGILHDVNETAAKFLGGNIDEVLLLNVYDMFPADVTEYRRARVDRVFSSGEPIRFEEEREGTYLDVVVYPVFNELGEVAMVAFVARDITYIKQAEKNLKLRNRDLEFLNSISRSLNSTLDRDQVLDILLEGVRRMFNVVACSVWLIDRETDELVCKHATGPQNEMVRGWRLALGEGIAGWVARSGENLIVPNAQSDERHFRGVDKKTGIKLNSIICIPLCIKDYVTGVIELGDTEIDRFDTTDLMLLEPLAASAATAIENARLYEKSQQEIEKRRRSEEALQESEERLALALDAASDGLWDGNIRTGERYFSPRWYTMLGYEPYEMPSTQDTWINLIHPEDRDRVTNYVKEYIESKRESYEVEFRLREKSGDYRWILSRGKIAEWNKEGSPLRMVGTHVDINEKKRAEEERIKALTELDQIFNTTTTGMRIIDKDFNVIRVNMGYLDLFGLQENKLIGEKCYNVSTHPVCNTDDCPLRRIVNGEGSFEHEVSRVIGEDNVLTCMVKSVPYYTPDGEMTGILENFTDITAIRRLEREIVSISDAERQRIGHDLHDELGQMLTGIGFLSEALRKMIERNPDIGLIEIDEIKRLVKKSTEFTRSLARALSPVEMDSYGFFSSLEEMSYDVNNLYGVRCSIGTVGDVLLEDKFVATQLYHIAQESVTNAIKHGRAGNISISLIDDESGFSMSIRDDGSGKKKKKAKDGLGMRIMKYRSDIIGAEFNADNYSDGFEVTVRVKK